MYIYIQYVQSQNNVHTSGKGNLVVIRIFIYKWSILVFDKRTSWLGFFFFLLFLLLLFASSTSTSPSSLN